jgi:ABC-type transporter Mla MlaB component
MAKEESGRLFSKVAKFVRNPLKDWSELDAPSSDSSLPDQAYSREMLKEMIERRQRNDFVRRREFDMLRKLRQREAAAHAFDPTVTPSSFNLNSSSEKPEGRALTLKKIDEIEQQMSQQWWKGRGPNGETLVNPPPDAGAETLPPVHTDDLLEEPAAARAPVPAAAAGAAVAGAAAASPAPASGVPLLSSRLAHDGALEEAVIRFAHGDDAGAEATLLQALASESATAPEGENDPAAERDDSRWRALFDLYRATGDAAKFAAARMRYAARMKRMGPDWVSLEELARSVKAVTASEDAGATAEGGNADWTSPARLAREGLMGLTRALSQAGSVWTLDWRGLSAIEARCRRAAARAVRALGRFAGATALHGHRATAGGAVRSRAQQRPRHRRHLVATAPGGAAHDAPAGRFRAGGAQLLHHLRGVAAFLARPEGRVHLAGRAAGQPAQLGVVAAVRRRRFRELPVAPTAGFAALAGDLRGDSLSCWQRLDNDLRHTAAPVISCAALLRMDLTAAGTLLSWVRARDANGERVQFVDAHRLIAALFNLMGIADHATVAVRKN